MGISTLRDASKKKRQVVDDAELKYGLNSSRNWLFYGSGNGKSTLALTQLEDGDSNEPVLVLSPGGASVYLQPEFPNAVFRTISSLEDLDKVLQDLEDNHNLIRNLCIFKEEPEKLKVFLEKKFLPAYYKGSEDIGREDFKYLLELATSGRFIFSRVILEEIDVVSTWIQEKVETTFNVEVLGEDKKKMGSEWSELAKEIISTYSRLLRLPTETILCTTDKLPSERQGLKQIIPSICTGQAQRLLTSLIGNVLYLYNQDSQYFIQIKPTAEALIRTKFFPLKIDHSKVPIVMDITNKPEAFWQYVEDCRNKKVPMI